MGLFDKKYCDVCGQKIGLLGNRKLEDGNLCKDCARKLSHWFDERRHSTVEQIKAQLAYREANREKAAAFHVTDSFGKDSFKLFVDGEARRFTVCRDGDFRSDNPDILDFAQVTNCEFEIDESCDEVSDSGAENASTHTEYSYSFTVTLWVNHPFFDKMSFDLNGSAVSTGATRMTNNEIGKVAGVFGSVFGKHTGTGEYQELAALGSEIKALVDGWKQG